MKSSKLLMATWLVVVGVLMFFAVSVILKDQGGPPGKNGSIVEEVPPTNGGGGGGKDDNGRPKVDRPNEGRPNRIAPHVKGRVLGPDGEPVVGAELRVSLPVENTPDPESADMDDVRFINSIIYIDPLEWDAPRPLASYLETLINQKAVNPGAQEIASGTSGDGGVFDIAIPRHVGIGPFRVTAEAPAGKAAAQGVRANIEIELTVGPVSAVTGTVLSGNENVGIAGATIVLDDGESRFVGTCDDTGNFRIEGVSPGNYSVTAGAEGHSPLLGVPRTVKTDAPLEIRLPRGATINVVAVFEPEEGPERPLADVEVVILEQDTFTYVRGRTDLNGVAAFKGMPPGSYLVNGKAERAISFGEELVELDGNKLDAEAELLFEPAIDTQLTVVDEDGQPVAGMEFYTANADEEYDALRSMKIDGQTDSQGRIQFPFEFEGPRALLFGFKKGYSMVRAYPDAHDEGIPMTLVAKKALRVYGTVRTPEGRAVPDALVLLEIEPEDPEEIDDFLIQIRSNSAGEYDFPYLPRGEIWISAELGDDAWSDDVQVEILEGQTEYKADIELELDFE